MRQHLLIRPSLFGNIAGCAKLAHADAVAVAVGFKGENIGCLVVFHRKIRGQDGRKIVVEGSPLDGFAADGQSNDITAFIAFIDDKLFGGIGINAGVDVVLLLKLF